MLSNLFAVAVLAGTAFAQSVNTPASLVECQPASITFSGGTSPYILAVIPGGQVSAAAIETLSDSLSTSPFTWNVNLAAGTNITLKITDSTGAIGYSAPQVIQAGSSQACLNQTAATSGVATGAVTTTRASASGAASASSAASSASSASSLVSSAASSATSAAGTSAAASRASSAAGSATSAAGSLTSAAASAATSAAATSAASGASITTYVGIPAVALALLGAVATLF
ncbi:hypothetical protein CI109_100814 [Kwoniella shandongensis]|uniref:Uncharacterized protein n=1 Tax=Kwoniella shandongensis TaxID=1734106 RepID=A0A5M6BUS5_9TREE|nr:uncharacterized protein CI109_006903 [Kwoniella shandongensis]KAA5524749.1 hypothetical protein CI109_006903 [Kwoniella shandongensis]